uniref:Recep_L_domain domain-containing protein n=1 Tax=Elaeophora elaphi TaxID=1147741 RepID=A0A0R3RNE7_9BILA
LRYTDLKELVVENCDRLRTIEKFAFKGLHRLKLLRLANNPSLSDVAKNAFSQISNRHGLRIQLVNNSFNRIRQGLFRQLSRLREFTLEGQNLKIEVNAFAGLTQVDFFNLIGVISFGSRSFENVSRVHRLEISRSNFSLSAGVFTAISHVREIHIISNDIDTISTGAFTGLYTIGCLIMSDNKIGNISDHAFSSIVNIGELVIERNNIRHLETEALLSEAWRTRFRDNTLYCNCVTSWFKHINSENILYEVFRLLSLPIILSIQ